MFNVLQNCKCEGQIGSTVLHCCRTVSGLLTPLKTVFSLQTAGDRLSAQCEKLTQSSQRVIVAVQPLSWAPLCDLVDCSPPSSSVPCYLLEFSQIHVDIIGRNG